MTFDPSNPDLSQQTTSTEQTTEAETTVVATPTPTPAPAPAAPNAEFLGAYNAVLREQQEEIKRLRAEAEQRNTPAPLSPEEQSRRFFETPLDLIRNEIASAVKPLNDFVAVTRRDQQYNALKSEMRLDPRFSRLSEIETEFDAMMKTSTLDANTMIGAYYAVLGMKVANGTLTATPATSTTPTPAPAVTTPAHLRPSATDAPAPTKTARRQLTENELRLARASGMTAEQYLDELEGPATLIVSPK